MQGIRLRPMPWPATRPEMTDFAEKTKSSLSYLNRNEQTLASNLEMMVTEHEYEANYTAILEAANAHLSSSLILNSKLIYLAHTCKNHNIPAAIISETTFLKDLRKIKDSANKNESWQ